MTRFIPRETLGGGGSLIGNTYLSTFWKCPRKWFNHYLRPYVTQDGTGESEGIRPRFQSEDLLKGGTFHEAMEALYKSGCRDGEDTGEWDLNLAQDVLEAEHLKRQPEYEHLHKWEEDQGLLNQMLVNYYNTCGPGGDKQDYPQIKVLHDGNGEPLIERDFTIDLGYGGYYYTCRVDLLMEYHGRPRVMEHKTSAYGMWVNKRAASIHFDSQFTGELLVLKSLFPEEPLDGAVVNIIIKGGKTELVRREHTIRDDEDLRTYRYSCLDVLKQIDQRVERFRDALVKGIPMQTAVNLYFPDHGERTGACLEYRGCEYQRLCRNKGREAKILEWFVGRTEGSDD